MDLQDLIISYMVTLITCILCAVMFTASIYTKKLIILQDRYEKAMKRYEEINEWGLNSKCADEYCKLLFDLKEKNNKEEQ